MTDLDAMFEAHVRYELARCEGEAAAAALAEECAALVAWLDGVKLGEVAGEAALRAWLRRTLLEGPVSDELVAAVTQGLVAAHDFLGRDHTTVAELLPQPLFARAVEQTIGLEALRQEATHQIVYSSVYAALVANVLYQGIKAFILTENVFARKLPGAASLVRFGQNALNAAAPKLEQSIDRQLTAFIHANIQDALRESEKFLNRTLDAEMVRTLGDEIWRANAGQQMGDLSCYVKAGALPEMVQVVKEVWLHVRATPFCAALLDELGRELAAAWAERSAAALLAEAGVTAEELARLAAPWLERARRDGLLAQRIRARLAPFYTQYKECLEHSDAHEDGAQSPKTPIP